MKKQLLIMFLFFPFWGKVAFAQGDFTRIYHPIINEAELAIVDTNYYEALDFYKEAFANVKKPFAKDYYNAAICAAMIGKLPLTLEYLEKIIEKGYPADSLRKDVFFHYVADTCKTWGAFEKQMKLVKPNINEEVRDSLNKLYALSTKEIYTPLTQELRIYFRENFKGDTVLIGGTKKVFSQVISADSLYFFANLPEKLKNQQDSIRKINNTKYSANSKTALRKTIELIEMNGFPDENMIGISGYDAKLLRVYRERDFSSSILSRNLTISLLGYSLNYSVELFTMLSRAIRDGKLIPHQINRINFSRFNTNTKTLEDRVSYSSLGKVQVIQLQLETNLVCENAKEIEKKSFWKKEHLGEYSEAEINEKRQDVGLEKLADAYKKAFFKVNRTPFIINGGNYQKELMYVSSCEILKKVMKESEIVK